MILHSAACLPDRRQRGQRELLFWNVSAERGCVWDHSLQSSLDGCDVIAEHGEGLDCEQPRIGGQFAQL